MKTLIYHAGALGDFITTEPLIRYLCEKYHRSITLISHPAHGRLSLSVGIINDWIDVDSSLCFAMFSPNISPKIIDFFSLYDEAFMFCAENSPIYTNIKRSSISRIVRQDPFPKEQIHIVDYHMSLLVDINKVKEPFRPNFNNVKQEIKLNNRVIIHPGSGSPKKNWYLSGFQEIADWLTLRGYAVKWIRGPAEYDFKYRDNDDIINVQDLIKLKKVISQSSLYMGNDSGISHLAAACGVPCIVIFIATEPSIWAPRGKSVQVIIAKEDNSLNKLNILKNISKIFNSQNYC